MVKMMEALSVEFKTYHCPIVDQTEEQNKLAEEQIILDEHEDKVEELMEHLEELVATTKCVIPPAPGTSNNQHVAFSTLITEADHLSRLMDQVHDSLTRVKRVVDDKNNEVNMCVSEGHEGKIKNINVDLQGDKRDMLLAKDYESLARRATDLEEVLFELRVAIKHLFKDAKFESATNASR